MQQKRARLDLPPLQSGRVFHGQIDDAGHRVLVEVPAYIPAPSGNVAAAVAAPAAPAVAIAPAPAAGKTTDQGAVDAAAEQLGADTDNEAVPPNTTAHYSSSESGSGSDTDGSAIEFSDSDSNAAADAAEIQEPGRAFAAVAAELEALTCWNDHRDFPVIELSDDKLAATFIHYQLAPPRHAHLARGVPSDPAHAVCRRTAPRASRKVSVLLFWTSAVPGPPAIMQESPCCRCLYQR